MYARLLELVGEGLEQVLGTSPRSPLSRNMFGYSSLNSYIGATGVILFGLGLTAAAAGLVYNNKPQMGLGAVVAVTGLALARGAKTRF